MKVGGHQHEAVRLHAVTAAGVAKGDQKYREIVGVGKHEGTVISPLHDVLRHSIYEWSG
jgi:hypothetical protein